MRIVGKTTRFVALLSLWSSALGAQDIAGALDKVFSTAHNIVLYVQYAGLNNKADITTKDAPCRFDVLCGAGIELLLDLTSTRASGAHIELGLGASYLRGFRSSISEVDLRGSLRSLPTLSAYVSDIRQFKYLSPYVGFSFGLADLWDAQVIDTRDTLDVQVSVKGTTFEYGPSGGFEVSVGSWAFVLEGGYRYRRFPSLDYANDTIGIFPKGIDAGGIYGSLAVVFHLKDDDESRDYTGTWNLITVEGQKLPAVRSQQTLGVGFSRSEINGGVLDLLSTRCYSLLVQSRVVTYDAAHQPTNVAYPPAAPAETGRWWVDDSGRLHLQPGVDCQSGPTEITSSYATQLSGDDLKLRHRSLAIDLLFRKKER